MALHGGFGEIGTQYPPRAVGHEQPRDADTRRAQADLAHHAFMQLPLHPLGGGEQRGQRHDRGAVLVVVQHRLGQTLLQFLLHLEAGRPGNVLQLNGAERLLDTHHRVHDQLGIGVVHQDGHAGQSGKLPEQRGLAFHDRQTGQCADVAQAQDGRAVGDDRHRLAQIGVFVGQLGFFTDGQAHACHPGRVDVAQLLQAAHRLAGHHLYFAALVAVEHAVRLAQKTGIGQRVDLFIDPGVGVLVHLQGDFPDRAVLVAAQGVHVLHHQAAIADHGQHLGQTAGLVFGFDEQYLGDFHGLYRGFRGPTEEGESIPAHQDGAGGIEP